MSLKHHTNKIVYSLTLLTPLTCIAHLAASPVLPVPAIRVQGLNGLNHLGLVEPKVLGAGNGCLRGRWQQLTLSSPGLDLVVDAAEDLSTLNPNSNITQAGRSRQEVAQTPARSTG